MVVQSTSPFRLAMLMLVGLCMLFGMMGLSAVAVAENATIGGSGEHSSVSPGVSSESDSLDAELLYTPPLEVVDIDGPEAIHYEETVELEASIRNNQDHDTHHLLHFNTPDGEEEYELSIDAGETTTVTLEWDPSSSHTGVGYGLKVSVGFDYQFHHVEVWQHDFVVNEVYEASGPYGEVMDIEAEIENVGHIGYEDVVHLYIDEPHPVDEQWVEIAAGETETVTFTWEPTADDLGTHLADVYTFDENIDMDSATVEVLEPARFDIDFGRIDHDGTIRSIEDTDAEVGDSLEIRLWISNSNDASGPGDTQVVTLGIDGTEVDSESLSLDGGESGGVSFDWEPSKNDLGTNTVVVATEDDQREFVVDVTGEPASFDVSIDSVPDSVVAGEPLDISAVITNDGHESGDQTITLNADEMGEVDSSSVALDGGSSETVEFSTTVDSELSDDLEVTVSSDDTSASRSISVLRPADISVSVNDDATDDQLIDGESFTLGLDLENHGDIQGEQYLFITYFYERNIRGVTSREYVEITDRTVTVDAGETITEHIDWDTSGDDLSFDQINISPDEGWVDPLDTLEVSVVDPAEFSIAAVEMPSTVVSGDTLTVETTVDNAGEVSDTGTIDLEIDGAVRDSTSIELAAGETDTVSLDWDVDSLDSGEYDVTISSTDDTHTTTLAVLESGMVIDEITREETIVAGTPTMLNATVTNVGASERTETIVVTLNDTIVADRTISLDSGDHRTVSFEFQPSINEVGTLDVEVDSGGSIVTEPITVLAPPAYEFLDVIDPRSVRAGETVELTVNVTNVGEAPGIAPITIERDNETLVEGDVDLAPNDTDYTTLEWDTEADDAGTHNLTITSPHDSITTTVTIDEPVDEASSRSSGHGVVASVGGGSGGGGGGPDRSPSRGETSSRSPTDVTDPAVDVQRRTHVAGSDRTTSTTSSIELVPAGEPVRIQDDDGVALASKGNFSVESLQIETATDTSVTVSTRVLDSPEETKTPSLDTEMENVTSPTYFEIVHDIDDALSSATISTSVSSDDVEDPSNTSIFHYTGEQWRSLETTYTTVNAGENETASTYRFNAKTDRFSTFAIGTLSDDPEESEDPEFDAFDDDEGSQTADEEESVGTLFVLLMLAMLTLTLALITRYLSDTRLDSILCLWDDLDR